jgi:hypothetical protein
MEVLGPKCNERSSTLTRTICFSHPSQRARRMGHPSIGGWGNDRPLTDPKPYLSLHQAVLPIPSPWV